MKMLAVGCSFLTRRGNLIPQVELVSKELKLELDNRSHPGRGNTFIVNKMLEALHNDVYELVVIGWSSPFRWDFDDMQGKSFSFKMESLFASGFNKPIDPNETQFLQAAPLIYLAATMLRSKKQPFIMFNSLPCWNPGDTWLHNEIKNMPEFLEPETCILDSIRDNQEWQTEDDHHPNQSSHCRWAQKILDKVNEKSME